MHSMHSMHSRINNKEAKRGYQVMKFGMFDCVGIAVVIVVGVGYFHDWKQKDAPIYRTTPAAINAQHDQNAISTDALLKDKRVVITGVVTDLDVTWGQASISLNDSGSGFSHDVVVNIEDPKVAEGLRKGDEITLIGTDGQFTLGSLVLDNGKRYTEQKEAAQDTSTSIQEVPKSNQAASNTLDVKVDCSKIVSETKTLLAADQTAVKDVFAACSNGVYWGAKHPADIATVPADYNQAKARAYLEGVDEVQKQARKFVAERIKQNQLSK